jgi:Tfp pilus assembly protein PilF
MVRGPAPDALEKLLAAGKDSALLRVGLANAYLSRRDAERAVVHLHAAIAQDADYSAAWKLLGRALIDVGRPREALDAYRSGIEVARRRGDKQAMKEMEVFARRIEKALGDA